MNAISNSLGFAGRTYLSSFLYTFFGKPSIVLLEKSCHSIGFYDTIGQQSRTLSLNVALATNLWSLIREPMRDQRVRWSWCGIVVGAGKVAILRQQAADEYLHREQAFGGEPIDVETLIRATEISGLVCRVFIEGHSVRASVDSRLTESLKLSLTIAIEASIKIKSKLLLSEYNTIGFGDWILSGGERPFWNSRGTIQSTIFSPLETESLVHRTEELRCGGMPLQSKALAVQFSRSALE